MFYDNTTNATLPILSFSVLNSVNGFIVDAGVPDTYTCNTQFLPKMTCLDVGMWLSRTMSTKSVANLALVVGWLLVVMSTVLFIAIAYYRPFSADHRVHSEAVLIFPVASILALPALRALFPGAPPSGE